MPLILTVVPCIVGALLLTYMRAENWLLEKNPVGHWARLATLVPGVGTCSFAGLVVYRVFEIPGGGPGFDASSFAINLSEDGLEVGEQYRALAPEFVPKGVGKLFNPETTDNAPDELDPSSGWIPPLTPSERVDLSSVWSPLTPSERELVEDGAERLSKLLELTKNAECIWKDPRQRGFDDGRSNQIHDIANFLLLAGKERELVGDLDGATEYYQGVARFANHLTACPTFKQIIQAAAVHSKSYWQMSRWVGRAHNDIQHLTELANWLRQNEGFEYDSDEIAKTEHLIQTHRNRQPPESFVSRYDWDAETVTARSLVSRYAPWELVRQQRFTDYVTQTEQSRVRSLRKTPFTLQRTTIMAEARDARIAGAESAEALRIQRWNSTSLYPIHGWLDYDLLYQRFESENHRRAIQWQIAIRKWQLDNDGELPVDLDQLPEFDELPRDAYSGEPFVYYRNGFAGYLNENHQEFAEVPVSEGRPEVTLLDPSSVFSVRIPARYPVLWSGGPNLILTGDSSEYPRSWIISIEPDTIRAFHNARNEELQWFERIWQTGTTYPIFQEDIDVAE